MKTLTLIIAGVCGAFVLACPARAQSIVKNERFDTPESAALNGWQELGSRADTMDYGYSAGTAYAGGSPGEAGGSVGRNRIRSMYADVFGSVLTLTNSFSATGRVTVAYTTGNAGLLLGHSDSSLLGQNKDLLNTMGVLVTPATGANNELDAVVGLGAKSIVQPLWKGIDVTGATVYSWSYSWDPAGGTSGDGALTVTASDGVSTSNLVISITAEQKAGGARFDSFGLTTRCLTASSANAQTFVDDVQYTALPPCARVAPTTVFAVPGQTNKAVTITIPPSANAASDIRIEVTSAAPEIAEPLGAVAGRLTLTFPAGGANSQTFYVRGIAGGSATLNLSSSSGICLAGDRVAVMIAPTAASLEKSENFDTAHAARTNGWSELGSREGGQNFGFSATSQLGSAGEAGGAFKRDRLRASYADVFGGRLTLNDALRASGTLMVPELPAANAGPFLGHFNSGSTRQASEANVLGLQGAYTAAGGVEFRARLSLADGSGYESAAVLAPAELNTIYYWDYTYDPAGGPAGNGTFTLNITDGISSVTNSLVIELTENDRATGAAFDSFGLSSRSLSPSDGGIPAFADNLRYTAVGGAPCVRFLGTTELVVVTGQTNKSVTVAIPAAANAGASFAVTIQSQNPAAAAARGADATGALVIEFPAGGEVTRTVPIEARGPGGTVLALSQNGGFCMSGPVTVTVLPTAATRLKTEPFDTAESARANGWMELFSRTNGQDYGFAASANAGGPAGEAGGTFKRDSTRSSYADVFGGKLTLNDRFSARGKVSIPGPHSGNLGPIFGYSDSARSGMNSAGAGGVAEASNLGLTTVNGVTFYLELILANGTRAGELAIPGTIANETIYDWDFAYDPAGGPAGDGSFTVNVSADGTTNSAVYLLTRANRETGAEFDSFGITSRALSSSDATGPAFIDNVAYSVPARALRIAQVEAAGAKLRLTIDTPSLGAAHAVLESAALGSAFAPVAGANFAVANGQIVAEFPKPETTRFYRVTTP